MSRSRLRKVSPPAVTAPRIDPHLHRIDEKVPRIEAGLRRLARRR